MADALVSFVVKELYDVAKDEFHLLNGVKKEVDELSSTYEHIKAALVKAERQQLTDQTIPDRLEKLKEVVYEVEDILDSWRIAAFRSQRYKDDIRSLRKATHEELRITKCPLVANQLEKEKGEGWRDISHIPSIEIDGKKIQ
ncbi:hypothetical protein AAC387_Pa12g1172 [Persea americana]